LFLNLHARPNLCVNGYAFRYQKNLLAEKLQMTKSDLAEEKARNEGAMKKLDRDYKKKLKDLQKQIEEKEMNFLAREVAANKEWTQEVEALEVALAKAQQEARQVRAPHSPSRIVVCQRSGSFLCRNPMSRTESERSRLRARAN